MIKLYHAQFTRSIRILWLLEELGIPYKLATVAFKPPRHSFEQDTPTGKFPAIEDDGLVLSESGAILEYLIEKYGKGRLAPAVGSPDRGPYLQWVHFAEATAFPPISLRSGDTSDKSFSVTFREKGVHGAYVPSAAVTT
jgi:glutathione S-transferase